MSSPKTSDSSAVTVTFDELAHAIDSMGLTQSVSAHALYYSILQVQARPSTPMKLSQRKTVLKLSTEPSAPKEFVMIKPNPESVTPARIEQRRKMVELAKAAFPNGVPSPYTTLNLESRESHQ